MWVREWLWLCALSRLGRVGGAAARILGEPLRDEVGGEVR